MRYKDMPLEELIKYLLTQHRETDFWDVKQEWHEHVEDLIKDIICFANTVHNEDCYLIIGITDELKIRGIGAEDMRRKQSDILDTLSALPFAGDNIPKIEIKTISMLSDFEQDKLVDIDVLIVFNSYSTPYYLKRVKKDYERVMLPGCIYSRVGDRNTPNKGNADIVLIEMLWRKRFGLTKPSLEFIMDSLSRKLEWNEYNGSWYNIYKPEYVLKIRDDDTDIDSDLTSKQPKYEFYSYSQTNESTTFGVLEIISSKTVLKHFDIVCLDSGRLLVPTPEWGSINTYNSVEKDFYKYYIINSQRYQVLNFMYEPQNFEQHNAFEHLMDVVLLFESENEKNLFENYVYSQKENFLSKVETCNKYDYIDAGNNKISEVFKRRLRVGFVLNEMLINFRAIS